MKNSRLVAVALACVVAATLWARCGEDPAPARPPKTTVGRESEANNPVATALSSGPERRTSALPADALATEPLDPTGLANGTGKLAIEAHHERDGQPATGMNLRLELLGEHEATQRVRADANGKASFESVPEGTYTLRNDRGDLGHEVKIRAGATTRMSYAVSAGLRVQGQVVDETGAAIAGAHLEITAGDGNDTYWVATSDATGQFTVLDVSINLWLSARIAGRTSAHTNLTESNRQLRLVLGPDGCCIEGFVILPDGSPIPEALVVVNDNLALATSARTDRFGHFTLIGLPAGSNHYAVEARGRASTQGTVEISPTRPGSLRIVMQEQGPIDPDSSYFTPVVNPSSVSRYRNR
jgi:hypothetical protein